MKDIKIKNMILAFSLVLLLILSSIGSFGTSTEIVEKDIKFKINTTSKFSKVKINSNIKTVNASVSSKNCEEVKTLAGSNPGIFDNFLIAGTSNNESYPSVVSRGLNYLIAYEVLDGNDPDIYFRKSNDYGENWSEPTQLVFRYEGNDRSINSPTLCIDTITGSAYGSFLTNYKNSGIHCIFEIPDITGDLSNIPIDFWDLSKINGYSFWDFKNIEIEYHKPYTSAKWITSFIGTTNYSDEFGVGPSKDTIMYMYQNHSDSDEWWIMWNPFIENCSNLSTNMNDNNEKIHAICEINNGTNMDLLYFTVDYEVDPKSQDPYLIISYQNFTGSENYTHPQIYVSRNHVYIVAETDEGSSNNIVLFHSQNNGASWSKRIITSNIQPSAAFTWSAERLNVEFKDESIDVDGYIKSWYWEFGDGGFSSEQNPSHLYPASGNYQVNLTVTDDDNAIDKISYIIPLESTNPIANFTYSPLKPRKLENISFNDTSGPYFNREIVIWSWNFGDGTNNESKNTTHKYTENGSYTVILKVEDNESYYDSVVKVVNVGLVADFSYAPKNPSIDDTIIFSDLSSAPEGEEIKEWNWDFGDGTTSNQQNPTHKYEFPGTYQVSLTVMDDYSTDTIMKSINVWHSQVFSQFPKVYANRADVFCTFIVSGNLIYISSANSGVTWTTPEQINSIDGSVEYGYDFIDFPDKNHIVWTDSRADSNDIYTTVSGFPDIDLLVIPSSVRIKKEGISIIPTKNRVLFNVTNEGAVGVSNVQVEVSIEFTTASNKDPLKIGFPLTIGNIEPGAVLSFDKQLIRLVIMDFIGALYRFAGIEYINITIDPNEEFKDINRADNTYKLPVTYKDIFPVLFRLENIFLILS